MSSSGLRFEGTVIETFKGAMFTVKLDNGHEVLASVCGRIRKSMIRVIAGDRCVVELSEYDLKRGRIIQRIG